MRIVRRRGWEIAERQVTPGHAVSNRRSVVAGAMALAILPSLAAAEVTANPAFKLDRAVADEKYATTYNNYYEFGESKNIWRGAQALKQRPWTIKLDGLMAKPRTVDIDDLLKQVTLEERTYRHRCVVVDFSRQSTSGLPSSITYGSH